MNRNTEHECVLEVLKRSDKLKRGTEAWYGFVNIKMLQDHFWSRIIMDIGIQLIISYKSTFWKEVCKGRLFYFFSRNKFFRTFFDRNLCQNYQHTIKILEIKKIYPVTWNLSQWQCYSNDIQSIFPTYIFTGELN